jgi:hypothetical protein
MKICRSDGSDRKRTEEKVKKFSKQRVSSQNKREKEEGATVAATPTFPHSGQLRAGRTGSVLHGNNFTGNPHKIPLMSY